jgi:hypothetical protein
MPMGFGGVGAFAGLTILITVIFSLAIPIAICWLLVVVMRNVAGGLGPRLTPRDPAADALRYRFTGPIRGGDARPGLRKALLIGDR